MNVYWIDDKYEQSSRRVPTGASKKMLEQGLNAELKVERLESHEDFSVLAEKFKKSTTIGILMDYQLMNVGANRSMEYGTTWAAQLRAIHPSIPIVGLSAEDESSIPKFRIENFLAFYKRKDLIGASTPVVELNALFCGYRTVWKKKLTEKAGLDMIMDLLAAPSECSEMLRIAIPAELRGNWDDETPHIAARWIWHDLQDKPGFLLDDIEAATFLGLTVDAFRTFQSKGPFVNARYQGVLACDKRPRWWTSMMRKAAETIIGERLVGPIAQSRDLLLKALKVPATQRQSSMAKPYGRKGSQAVPECVAFPDQSTKNDNLRAKRVPALLADTIVDEVDANQPFGFQAPRHFKLDPSL